MAMIQFQKIFLRICFAISIFSFFAPAEESLSFTFWGFKARSPAFRTEIIFKNNAVDLSPLIQNLEDHLSKSRYDNSVKMERFYNEALENITDLCRNHNSFNSMTCVQMAGSALRTAIDDIQDKMSDRIFYPYHYIPISQKSLDVYNDLTSSLDEHPSCCSEYSARKTAIVFHHGSSEQHKQALNKMRNKNKQCQKKIFNHLMKFLERDAFPKKCLQTQNNDHPLCRELIQNAQKLQARTTELSHLIYGSELLNSEDVLCTPFLESKGDIHSFINFINSADEFMQCMDPAPLNEKIVQSGTGLDDQYRLKKTLDGKYQISLNLRFKAGENYDGETPAHAVPAHYMNRVQECLQTANQKMLGPNGESLNIVIESSEETSCDAKTIKIQSKNFRSNSMQYESNIDCPTITHEVLHLLGLCDEYKERGKYTCRVTSDNSIMSNHYKRWYQVFDKKTEASLLNPQQFNSILYGTCSKNKQFNECSKLAYSDSSSCKIKKNQCEQQNIIGSRKKPLLEKLSSLLKRRK